MLAGEDCGELPSARQAIVRALNSPIRFLQLPDRGSLFGPRQRSGLLSIVALSAFGQGGMKLDAVPGSPRLDVTLPRLFSFFAKREPYIRSGATFCSAGRFLRPMPRPFKTYPPAH
jgi:hypothetical protein